MSTPCRFGKLLSEALGQRTISNLAALFRAQHVHPPQPQCIIAGLPSHFPQVLFRQILIPLCPLVHPPLRATDRCSRLCRSKAACTLLRQRRSVMNPQSEMQPHAPTRPICLWVHHGRLSAEESPKRSCSHCSSQAAHLPWGRKNKAGHLQAPTRGFPAWA